MKNYSFGVGVGVGVVPNPNPNPNPNNFKFLKKINLKNYIIKIIIIKPNNNIIK